jgi:hypothetical protein
VLLFMVRHATAATAEGVGLLVAFTEGRGASGHALIVVKILYEK